jgi:hypothetical protein
MVMNRVGQCLLRVGDVKLLLNNLTFLMEIKNQVILN